MHEELVNTLLYDAGWLEQGITQTERDIAEHLRKAARAIEELSMKLHGDEAAIAGMKREIERMVVAGKPRWIPVTEMLPEESEGLDWREEMMIRFTSVWCCDAKTGTIEVRNRFQHKKTGIQFLDQNIKDTDGHWSTSWWEPTHWMPIVPLPEPPKEET